MSEKEFERIARTRTEGGGLANSGNAARRGRMRRNKPPRQPSYRARVAAWVMWDPGTQPFASVITTFVFSVYIVSAPFGSKNHTSTALAWTMSLAGLAIALLAPVTGQWAERKGLRIGTLRWMTWALALLSGLLFFVQAQANYLILGLIILGVGSVLNDVGSSIYNGLLGEVTGGKNVGRISGIGWGLGYVGGIISLLVIYMAWIKPEVGLLGVTSENGMNVRVSMVFCALWIFLMTLPTFLILQDRKINPGPEELDGEAQAPANTDSDSAHRPKRRGWIRGVKTAYVELWHSVVSLWKTNPNLIIFLGASALFRDGVNGVFQFGGPIATQTFGFSTADVMVFGIGANVIAGIATIVSGWLDDAVGPRWVINASLWLLVICGLLIFFLHDGSHMVFWIVGLAMCAFVGPVQSASRSYLARICPPEKQGEVFGLYATTGKAVSFLAPLFFGLFVTAGRLLSGGQDSQYWGILGIVLVLVAGLVAMIWVRPAPKE